MEQSDLTVEELMKKSLQFALAATLIAGTSNLSVIKDKLQVKESNHGTIIIQQVNEQALFGNAKDGNYCSSMNEERV